MHQPTRKNFKTIRDLFSLFRIHPWALPTILALGIFSSLSEGFGIGLFIPFLHGLEKPGLHPQTKIWLENALREMFSFVPPDRRLMVIAACIFGSILLKALLSFSAGSLFSWIDMRITHGLRCGLLEHLLNVEYRCFEQSPSGKLFNTISTETWRTSDALRTLVELIITTFMIGVYAALLFLISWKLTVLVMVFMAMVSLVIRAMTRHAKDLGTNLTKANALFSKRMVQTIDGMKIVRAFGREAYEQQRFDKASARISRLAMRLMIASGLVNPIYEILAGGLLLYVLFTTFHTPSGLTPFLVFIFVLYRLQPKIKDLDEQRVKLNSLYASVEDVMFMLDHGAHFRPASGMTNIERLTKGIRFEHVFFDYGNPENPALNDVSTLIPSGKTTALVGPSGGGKSTLIKLILRLYDPAEGIVFADKHPLRELDITLWRKQIALVSQDVYLFDATVKENIAYGRLDATDEEIMEAARQADADGFISQLPEGYDTEIGDRGLRLSGGQQQRISLARAFLRMPEILILDEPTSFLDTLSENLIKEALNRLPQECTVVIIAHRLSTIEKADHIIVLEAGRVCEEGNLPDLLAQSGLFAKLYDLKSPEEIR